MLKPPLKWAGGKRWLVPRLKDLWKPFSAGRLIDPFCGGLSIALGLEPEKAILNDVNPHVMNFYRWLQKGMVIKCLMENDRKFYLERRTMFNSLVSRGESESLAAAELFYYMNRTGFNGLCRFNKKGGFNVPFGKYKKITYTTDFMSYAEPLSKWELKCGDFMGVPLQSGDFIYADPPYDVEFRQYSKDGFEWADQERLAIWLSKHDGPVIASNQATSRILDLYMGLGFNVEQVDAPRMISCTGDRTKAKEMFATRNI
jgi:DNA adenine methylase